MAKKETKDDVDKYMEKKQKDALKFISKCLDTMSSEEKLSNAPINQIASAMGIVMDKFTKKEDDGGNIFNIYRKNFFNSADFSVWINDAFERSIIDADIDVCMDDRILTLVTEDDAFEDARLVVMARKLRNGNDESVSKARPKTNPDPKYPKKWYLAREIS